MSVLCPAPLQVQAALLKAMVASWEADSCSNPSPQPSHCRS